MGVMAAEGLVDALVRKKTPEHAVNRQLADKLFQPA
jgi:hypothetical protein